MNVKQVEQDLRKQMEGMNLDQVCRFAMGMGVQVEVGDKLDEIKDKCVQAEVYAFIH